MRHDHAVFLPLRDSIEGMGVTSSSPSLMFHMWSAVFFPASSRTIFSACTAWQKKKRGGEEEDMNNFSNSHEQDSLDLERSAVAIYCHIKKERRRAG
jgi:hypothetical protein